MMRKIVLIWLGWALIVPGFQAWAMARFQPAWPDRAQDWTTRWTGPGYQTGHIYLLEPFMNNQVAWDSEYYLGIAVGGYDNPAIPTLDGQHISLAYAFLPFYPLLMRILAVPLGLLGLNPIAAATLAGVLISALGALAAMLALYDLTRDSLGDDGGLRAAFYLIIFPTGFFLIQVYTEGLFAGLAFGCLALLKRGHWLPAALLSVAATLTRAVGVALLIPLTIAWLRTFNIRQIFGNGFSWRPAAYAVLVIFPLITFAVWKNSYLGTMFDLVESLNYGRGALNMSMSFYSWLDAFRTMVSFETPEHSAYYFTEFFGILIALAAILRSIKTHSELAWFSLAVFLISWTSGPAQGMLRYILGAPAVFVTLAHWGKSAVFDRVWTIFSLLLMGLLATLFAFNMWVG